MAGFDDKKQIMIARHVALRVQPIEVKQVIVDPEEKHDFLSIIFSQHVLEKLKDVLDGILPCLW